MKVSILNDDKVRTMDDVFESLARTNPNIPIALAGGAVWAKTPDGWWQSRATMLDDGRIRIVQPGERTLAFRHDAFVRMYGDDVPVKNS